MSERMIEKRTWEEFRAAGLLWWANRILHVFGWAIVVEVDAGDGSISDAYPSRCKFRGFGEQAEGEGHEALSRYIAENAPDLLREAGIPPEEPQP